MCARAHNCVNFVNALHVCMHEINCTHGRLWKKFALVCVLCRLCVLACAVEGKATGLNKSLAERIFMKREVNAT